jgi:hypothetical protein
MSRNPIGAALLVLSALVLSRAQAHELPQEVARYLRERETCEHFLGEPIEGRTPEERQRRDFVAGSIATYCAGTDKRLSDLKRRYVADQPTMEILNRLEEKLE